MKNLAACLFVAYFIVGVKGDGTDKNPYLPDVNVPSSFFIPVTDGLADYPTCVIVVNDRDALSVVGSPVSAATVDVTGRTYKTGFSKYWIKFHRYED